jgi:choline dehydrogenase
LHTDPLSSFVNAELRPGPDLRSDEELLAYARQACGTAFHFCGTARMGSDVGAVVDPQLRVHGIDRLRVADASVMPAIISGNTNATSMMIGERAAEFIKSARSRLA